LGFIWNKSRPAPNGNETEDCKATREISKKPRNAQGKSFCFGKNPDYPFPDGRIWDILQKMRIKS